MATAVNKKWLLLIAFIFSMICGLILLLSWSSLKASDGQLAHQGMALASLVEPVDFGGAFTLVNQDGELTASAALGPNFKLIFFGFTACPEVCPVTLEKMTRALEHMPASQAEKVLPVFVSIDPANDTPERIKNYIASFHPRFAGFTGDQGQVDAVLARYRVFARKNADMETQVDHTSFIYLTDREDAVIAVFRPQDKVETIARAVAKNVAAAGKQ